MSHRYISWVEVPVYVDYDYQPFERETLEYPGCDENVIINDIEFMVDIKKAILRDEAERFREEALENYKDRHRGRY